MTFDFWATAAAKLEYNAVQAELKWRCTIAVIYCVEFIVSIDLAGTDSPYIFISKIYLITTDPINYAKSLIDITEEYSIIIDSTKILHFQNSEPWVKKDGNEDFDISMGCYDGANICELVGSFIQKSTRNSNGKKWHRFILGWWFFKFSRNVKNKDRKKEKTNCWDFQIMWTRHNQKLLLF